MSAPRSQSLPIYPADRLRAVDGANSGDPLSFAAELILDDSYALEGDAGPARLALLAHPDGSFTIAPDTAVGTPGHRVHLDSALTFMSNDGQTADAILLVEVDATGHATGVNLHPFTALALKTEYRLVGIDLSDAARKFAQLACVSFTRGTHITLATGAQRRVEDLVAGDRVLTRDAGVQPLRWIGQSTQRATGDFAPIRIAAGVLNNAEDLLVSPDHRLFIYQRSDRVGAGRAELLIKARHLLNGTTITKAEGGFVDYFQLLFDRHQIIYAEGIAAESTLIDSRTKLALPDDLMHLLSESAACHDSARANEFDVSENLLRRADIAEILRMASTR